jgi:putative ABC transport system ATP-binding protein/lipoprotein-releasing system ATP-binding protein
MRLVAEGLHFSYPGGDRSVLANLSFEVQSGTSAAIIGPSGSGKTTLLSVLGGLLPPQRGLFRCTDDDGLDHAPADVATWVGQVPRSGVAVPSSRRLASIFHGGPVWGWSAPVASRLF